MTDFLFDTNVAQALIDPRVAKRSPQMVAEVEARVRQQGGLVISVVTAYELRRGVRVLRLRDRGRRKEVRIERLIRTADVLGLDVPAFGAWMVAAELFAQASVKRPSIVIDDADLLIAATAKHYGRTLVTSDARLAENLEAVGQGPAIDLLRVT
ncbi:MAG: PIN domain-containing protein [Myxococcales bacterium]|nr:PIN domain-containing protein [Myxococcales bacterium]MCB9576001.1 PIN domain-containing protein [Polyangiaceae bacterium]